MSGIIVMSAIFTYSIYIIYSSMEYIDPSQNVTTPKKITVIGLSPCVTT